MDQNTTIEPTENQVVETTDLKTEDLKFAGFWIRFAALLLDGIVLYGVFFLLRLVLNVDLMRPPANVTFIEYIIMFTYYVSLTVLYGQTLGKMALGIQVVRQDGSPNTWGYIILREVIGKFVSTVILLIGYIMAGFDSKKRGLHDRIGSTYVVKVK
jgi:uncharacterized RDD family membrane protein YckC